MITSRRWNAQTGTWDTYTPARRQYPELTQELKRQLDRIMPSVNGSVDYFPCSVTLTSGDGVDLVYIVDAESYINAWGVWPDEDRGKRAIQIQQVREIKPSPKRLPLNFAQQMY